MYRAYTYIYMYMYNHIRTPQAKHSQLTFWKLSRGILSRRTLPQTNLEPDKNPIVVYPQTVYRPCDRAQTRNYFHTEKATPPSVSTTSKGNGNRPVGAGPKLYKAVHPKLLARLRHGALSPKDFGTLLWVLPPPVAVYIGDPITGYV